MNDVVETSGARVTNGIVQAYSAETPSFMDQLRLLARYRDLLFLWTRRELLARYRQSVLGFGWGIVQPVFQIVVISVIFGSFIHIPSEGFPYPIFAFTALLPWILFASSVGSATPTILIHMQFLTKIYFPREILLFAAILTRIVDFLVGLIVFAGLMIWYGTPVHITILYVPLLLLIQTLLALGVSLLGATISVFVRDISFAVPFALQLSMYASPVIYPLSAVPEKWRALYVWNPMAGILDSYRRVVLSGEPPDAFSLGLATAIALVLTFVGYGYFKKLERSMSDVL